MTWEDFDRWQGERSFRSFSRWSDRSETGQPTPFEAPTPLVDEFGLSLAIYERFPYAVRYYVNEVLEYLGMAKDEPPQGQGFGTIPELVFYGLLLEVGWTPTRFGFLDRAPKRFIFQSRLLGGRQPGGAVADFVLFTGGRTNAVRISSVYHSEDNPVGSGGAKTEGGRRQRSRLRSAGFLDNVVDVNRPGDRHPLENGPLALMKQDRQRALSA